MLHTYNGKDVVLIINGTRITGFDENDMFEVSRNNPTFEGKAGADGEFTRYKTNDKSGKLKIKLAYSSPANAMLSTLLGVDEATGAGVFGFGIQDLRGTTSAAAEQAWVTGWPSMGIAKETPVIEWEVEASDLDMFVGGLL